jgi:CRP/FNR family transcriptional regulator, cyclic AMP receptor protein
MIGHDDLRGFAALGRLDARQLGAVARYCRPVHVDEGIRLFEVGQIADGCWLIRRGRVALETPVPGRGQVVLQTLGPGDVLGWSSWTGGEPRWQVAAVAAAELEAIQLDTAALHDLSAQDAVLGYRLTLGLFEAMLGRLQATRLRLLDVYGGPRDR